MTLVLVLGLQLAGGVGFARHHQRGGMMRGALSWWDYWETTQTVLSTGVMSAVWLVLQAVFPRSSSELP